MKAMNIKKIGFAVFAFAAMCCAAAGAQPTLQIYGHRGEPTLAPQNTAESIKLAFDLGAQMVETDFYITKDGTMLCMHGKKELKSLWNIDKKPQEMTLEDILSSRLATPEKFDKKYANCRIPTIDEVFAAIPKDRCAEIEIKTYDDSFADKIDAARKKAGLSPKNLVIISFNDAYIKDFKSKYPEYKTVLIVGIPKKSKPTPEALIKRLKNAGASEIAIGNFRAIDAAFVKKIKDAGYLVGVWTVNDASNLAYAVKIGADRLCTDRVHSIKKECDIIKNTTFK